MFHLSLSTIISTTIKFMEKTCILGEISAETGWSIKIFVELPCHVPFSLRLNHQSQQIELITKTPPKDWSNIHILKFNFNKSNFGLSHSQMSSILFEIDYDNDAVEYFYDDIRK